MRHRTGGHPGHGSERGRLAAGHPARTGAGDGARRHHAGSTIRAARPARPRSAPPSCGSRSVASARRPRHLRPPGRRPRPPSPPACGSSCGASAPETRCPRPARRRPDRPPPRRWPRAYGRRDVASARSSSPRCRPWPGGARPSGWLGRSIRPRRAATRRQPSWSARPARPDVRRFAWRAGRGASPRPRAGLRSTARPTGRQPAALAPGGLPTAAGRHVGHPARRDCRLRHSGPIRPDSD